MSREKDAIDDIGGAVSALLLLLLRCSVSHRETGQTASSLHIVSGSALEEHLAMRFGTKHGII